MSRCRLKTECLNELRNPWPLTFSAAQRRDRICDDPAEHVVAVGVHIPVAVRVRQHLTELIVGVRLLLARARVAGRCIRVLHRADDVVRDQPAACAHAEDIFSRLVAARQIGLERLDIAVAVERVLDGLVVGVAGRAVDVVLDRLRRPAGEVVELLADQRLRVGGRLKPAGGVVLVIGDNPQRRWIESLLPFSSGKPTSARPN